MPTSRQLCIITHTLRRPDGRRSPCEARRGLLCRGWTDAAVPRLTGWVLSGASGTASHISTPAQWAFGAGESALSDCSPPVLAPPSPYTSGGGRRQRARAHRGITRRHGRAARTGASMECTVHARVAEVGGKGGLFGHLCTVEHRNNGVLARGLGWARASARRSAGKGSAESARARPDSPSPYGDGRGLVGIGRFWLICFPHGTVGNG